MTSATYSPVWAEAAPAEDTHPAPPRKPRDPLFLTDCATPAMGTTLLLALWQRWDDTD